MKNDIFCVIGITGSVLTGLIGGWDSAVQTLLMFMFIDLVLGVISALVFKRGKRGEITLRSDVMIKGIFKKFAELVVVIIGCRLDILLNVNYVRDCSVIILCCNELLSIVELLGIIGVPMPDIVIKSIDILKERGNHNGSK